MNKVIITGANGFIGSSLVKKMIENNVHVVGLDISFENSNIPESDFVEKIEVSLENVEEMLKKIPVDSYDAFYHLAWQGVNGSDKADPNVQLKNCQMTINCATAAKNLNCKKLLCAGTIAEQATKSLPLIEKASGGMMYGVAKYCTHLILENYCKSIEQKFVWMQFSNIYGPTNKTGNLVSYTLDELAKGNEATFGPALQPYDFIYVDDLIEAVYRLGKKDTLDNFYFIGSGEPRLLSEYLIEIGQVYGCEELIKIGVRPDDGIVYTMDMFDCSNLKQVIGEYKSMNFTDGIRYTIENI